MPSDRITYQNSGYFSKLIIDYLNQDPKIKELYHRFPLLENFEKQIEEKQLAFSDAHRTVLHSALIRQYRNDTLSDGSRQNIELLRRSNTFTVTTGHQLNLFTGPLYFLYKIISTINLCRQLKKEYPNQHFVPVYWMATEDHDFDEINHFQFEEKKIQWNKAASGPVGRLDTKDLENVFEVFSAHLGLGNHANQIREWFSQAYLKHDNLADATRFLANALFGQYGLVILDGDDVELKKIFASIAKKELLEQSSIEKVKESYPILNDYFIQVNPRNINLFYISDHLRERIIFENNAYQINNTTISFSKEEILSELELHPERFSPNVILRPLYQEAILPNLCYIGGGGELAYWLELKKVFEVHQLVFPMLLLRNSVLLVTEKQAKKRERLQLSWSDLFLKHELLIDKKTSELSQNSFDFEQQRQFLIAQFQDLEKIALRTDASFNGAVKAQTQKQLKGLDQLEKRLHKAEKKLHAEALERISQLQLNLFPNNSLQERVVNFSEFYKEYGPQLIQRLFEELNPLEQQFNIVQL
ncbi:bacillithiol biosynthesis cysteine-adding enzyme BshC [Flavobacterium sp. NKUCC04_CG]|uniref:bacillithiol biosynthesis cysteine-adding enzyme BshC n=1 Tax=Flavobacterium sp. NKUCC04_CG TaxID=2842121 RepID=UPI001C5B34D4|nr:bacillithiol biosynthesis cysteine-adding enzyme BshC [Flavobacterium sp. NKUCC04_CG]MBW3519388.1 bacillithiol biosynthesis cysteine-adding enzyme BshC [Flavobacterium sp. NKUCC04_CG]